MKNISLKNNSVFIIISLCLIVIITLSFCNTSSGSKTGPVIQNQEPAVNDIFPEPVANIARIDTVIINSPGSIPYDLDNPDETYYMPGYLKEISGMAYYKDDKILCIQDENGEIFVLSLKKKGIVNKYGFAENGDYEDIAVYNQTAWVIRSDGRIFRIDNFEKETRKIKAFKTPLSSKNNAEGIVYDNTTKSLYIACKGSASFDKENSYKGYRAVYSVATEDMKFVEEPSFLINLRRPECFRDEELYKRFALRYSGESKKEENDPGFEPSGLSIHPLTSQIYLLSGTSKLLLILDRKGIIQNFKDLDPLIFVQPEGICFSPVGEMYISNEGKDGKGTIVKFTLRNVK